MSGDRQQGQMAECEESLRWASQIARHRARRAAVLRQRIEWKGEVVEGDLLSRRQTGNDDERANFLWKIQFLTLL